MASQLIAGLGNPGAKYQSTRHNIGFDILDCLVSSLEIKFEFSSKFNAEITKYLPQETFFIKPHTFMNLSGEAIRAMMDFYKIESLFVAHDDLDLPLGTIRFKKGGSSGGHNGLKSIDKICGNEYYRLRFGIGRDEKVIDYVLGKFTPEETKMVAPLIEHSKEALKDFIQNRDFLSMQNKFTQNIKVNQ